jgi:hypothetical protein
METKKCISCKEEKEISFFSINRRNLSGINNKCKSCDKIYYDLNRETLLNNQKKRYNREFACKRVKEYRIKKYGDKAEIRRLKNIEKEKIKQNKKIEKEYFQKHIRPIKNSVRVRMWKIINHKDFDCMDKIDFYLGCDYETLKQHLEKQFTKGMNWDNKEHWHLDHIIPFACVKKESDLTYIAHYTNIQPLWAEDNLKKNRVPPKLSNIYFKKTYL